MKIEIADNKGAAFQGVAVLKIIKIISFFALKRT